MKRAVVVGSATVLGVGALLALNPDDGSATTPSAASSGSSSGSSAGSGSSSSSGSSAGSGSSSGSGSSTGTTTYTGDPVFVDWGNVQVEISVSGGRLVDITALQLPDGDGRSQMISQTAFPQLKQQALAAQSADIAGVSGASYTTSGFEQSLKSALQQAGIG
jgi:uncharacterized protein with FMN-binding domain